MEVPNPQNNNNTSNRSSSEFNEARSNARRTRTEIPPKKNGGVKSNEEILKSIVMDDVRESAKKLKYVFMGQMEIKLSQMMDDVVNSMEQTDLLVANKSMMLSSAVRMKDKRRASVVGRLPEKEFRCRPSPLTELFQIQHFKTIHHIFISTLALFMINTAIMDLLQTGSMDLGFEGLVWAVGPPQLPLTLLAGMHFITLFLVYPFFYAWATHRTLLLSAERRRMLDFASLALFALFMILFIYIPASILWKNPLAPASGAAVTMEQCRLLMKIYAFVRHNVPRALKFPSNQQQHLSKAAGAADVIDSGNEFSSSDVTKKPNYNDSGFIEETDGLRNRNGAAPPSSSAPPNDAMEKKLRKRDSWISFSWDDEDHPCPDYSKYLYYLFAPTLIYRDLYPRTNRIRWNFVVSNFGQCIGCIIYANFIVSRFCATFIYNFGLSPINLTQLLQAIFHLMLPGILCLILGFFLLLHAWHNAFAEMLCFGDRLFYKDWWNCSSFASYYKTWNILVHDWLYTYVFKDSWECGLGDRWKALPTTLVFLISSIFHEYILSFSFNFFFPVLLTLFGGFGFAFVFIKNRQSALGNIAMWMCLIVGTGIIFTFYGIEYFARRNCPPQDVTAWDFFKPRALSCDAIIMSFS